MLATAASCGKKTGQSAGPAPHPEHGSDSVGAGTAGSGSADAGLVGVSRPEPPRADLPLLPCRRPVGPVPVVEADCPNYSCGNSARVDDAIIEALDLRGEERQDFDGSYQLLPDSLHATHGPCQSVPGLRLDVQGGDFVGMVGTRVVCAGADLEGATFQVVHRRAITTRPAPGTETATIKINKRATIPAWVPSGDQLPTYELTARLPSGIGGVPGPEQDLCPRGRWIDLAPGDRAGDIIYLHPTRLALLVQGEVYRQDASVDPLRTGPRWVNIACAGSGMAKMRLLGFDPMRNRPSGQPASADPRASIPDERQTTLKMLTAKYCGAASYTIDGTRIYLVGHGSAPLGTIRGTGWPDPQKAGPIESQWGPRGATCLSHFRLWVAGSACAKDDEAQWLREVQQHCGIPACDAAAPCMVDDEATTGVLWKTCTVNHISHAQP
jgi:hypothetical protein